MKKLILTFALALFSQSFADCIHTVFEYEQATIAGYDKSFDGLLFDSMYVDKGTANTRGNSIYILKYYWTGDKVDSAYEANLRNGEWQYKTTINPDSVVYDIDHVENNWTIMGSANGVSDTISIYFDGDSLAITSTDEAGKYTNIYVMGNDTLFRRSESEIIVNDEKDTNTCYVKDSRDNYVTTWYRYDTEVKNDKVIVSKTYIEDGLDHKVMTYFMFRRKGGTTAIHRNIRSAIVLEKTKQFDLLGRPAKSKHIIKVNR